MRNCPHLTMTPLPHGTVHQVAVRVNGDQRTVLVEGFPASYCPACGEIFTSLGWDMAAQDALEHYLNRDEPLANVISFADLAVHQPSVLGT